ncbi:MAG TPA: Ni/Fe hydrogenase, partial [Ruminiclostridium sp.]|nr:Ni/Fe hydrogenase [Ruminiclostridium sp.]
MNNSYENTGAKGSNVLSCLMRECRNRFSVTEKPQTNLVWLELTGCSGNIISLLDGDHPDFSFLISHMVNLVYNNSLMAAEGNSAMEQLKAVLDTPYILAVEGAVATANNGCYNIIGQMDGRP